MKILSIPCKLVLIALKFSTLVLKRTSNNSAHVSGVLYFDKDVTLRIFEAVDFLEYEISDYGYEVYHGDEKLYWYDCWPHPMTRS